jgi:hypothetical protein
VRSVSTYPQIRLTLLALSLLTCSALTAQTPIDRGQGQRTIANTTITNGKYYALVIGINDYPKPLEKLQTAVHDAQEISQVLQDSYNFTVQTLLDPHATRDEIYVALSAYQDLKPEDSLLIYYAGHGQLNAAGRAYWLPFGADTTKSLVAGALSADDITNAIQLQNARHVLVISDSCFSGGLITRDGSATSTRGDQEYLGRMSNGISRNIMSSGGNQPVADGGANNHSIFAFALLNALKTNQAPEFTGKDLYEVVSHTVQRSANQDPKYGEIRAAFREPTAEVGDFVFNHPTLATPENPETPLTLSDPVADEIEGRALYDAQQYNKAVPLLTRSCEIGYSTACADLGRMYLRGTAVKQDYTKAFGLSMKGCVRGDSRGCADVGYMFEYGGAGYPVDYVLAKIYYGKGCDAKNRASCDALERLKPAQNARVDSGLPKQLEIGCNGGNMYDCNTLGTLYEAGTGVLQNSRTAFTLFDKACRAGNGPGCADLGNLFHLGHGVPANLELARKYLQMGCDLKNMWACGQLKALQ